MLPTTWGKMLSIKPESTATKLLHERTALSLTEPCTLSGWPGKDAFEIKMCLETALGLVPPVTAHPAERKSFFFKSKRLISLFAPTGT